jgi:hypothetical protein
MFRNVAAAGRHFCRKRHSHVTNTCGYSVVYVANKQMIPSRLEGTLSAWSASRPETS